MSVPESKRGNRKRPRDGDFTSPIDNAYSSLTFSSIEPSGAPGTPHSFFKETYRVETKSPATTANKVSDESDKEQQQSSSSNKVDGGSCCKPGPLFQVVHKHANGLAVITIGNLLDGAAAAPAVKIKEIRYTQKESPVADQSAASKRKHQSKMLQGKKNVAGTIHPTDTLAEIELEDGSVVLAKACVWGSILEINKNMSPHLLKNDPLLDGYLAVILPSGQFPPPPPSERDTKDQPN
mmetsp:Transcript_4203/g.5531  ORF Transcript_4203/g.5531 Transcript_4203/m.5531 type:complete len:237 (+) Transcript_4203:116-826(+)